MADWRHTQHEVGVRFSSFEDLVEYRPEGHEGVVNRLLAGRENLGIVGVSIWHGRLDPGGRSDLHAHDSSLQIYVGVSGEMIAGNRTREVGLGRLATAVFPAGTEHFIANRSDEAAEVLVISVPGLR